MSRRAVNLENSRRIAKLPGLPCISTAGKVRFASFVKTENLRQYYAIQLSYIAPANIELKAGLLFELTRSVYGTVSPDDGVMKVSTQRRFHLALNGKFYEYGVLTGP